MPTFAQDRNRSPFGRNFYVSSRSDSISGDGSRPDRPFTTLDEALNAVGSVSDGSTIHVAPGSTFSVDAADWASELAASDVTIRGYGRATLNWTAAGSTFLLDQAGTVLDGLVLNLAGSPAATAALTVAAPITVSARHCAIKSCIINTGVDANQIITVGITTADGADHFTFGGDAPEDGNYCWSGALTAAGAFEDGGTNVLGAEITAAGTFIRLIGADMCKIKNNYIAGALATDTDGLIESLTTPSRQIDISNNFLWAGGAGNTCAIDFGAAILCTGRLYNNLLCVEADGTAETVVFTRDAANSMALLDNFMVHVEVAGTNSERGLVIGTASA